jgi:hypothetical protein
MIGSNPATTLATVMIFGRRRRRAPSIAASRKVSLVSAPVCAIFRREEQKHGRGEHDENGLKYNHSSSCTALPILIRL